MFSSMIRSQENSIVLATKAIIETHAVERRYKNYHKKIIKGLQ